MVGKDKQRMTISIHNETKALMDELLSLHSNMTYSVLVEISLLCYAKLVQNRLDQETSEEAKEGEKN